MNRIITFALMLAAVSMTAFAGLPQTPEIDPASGSSALALISGACLILRARRSK